MGIKSLSREEASERVLDDNKRWLKPNRPTVPSTCTRCTTPLSVFYVCHVLNAEWERRRQHSIYSVCMRERVGDGNTMQNVYSNSGRQAECDAYYIS